MPDSPPHPIVLLVEDSEDDAFFFRHTLRKGQIDCELFQVADGGEAINYLKTAFASPDDAKCPFPDLVFLDLKLPTFSGFEILEWIRSQSVARELDITVVSGSEQDEDVARAMELGAAAFFTKPVSIDQLRARFSAWTKTHAAPGAV